MLSNLGLKKVCEHLYHAPNFLLTCWGTQDIVHKDNCATIVKEGRNWKFIFRWRVINLHILQTAKTHFTYTILFHDFWKSITKCTFICVTLMAPTASTKHTKNCAPELLILSAIKLPSRGIVIFIDINSYVQNAEPKFQNILERKLWNWFGHLLILAFTKKILNMELNMMLIVLMEYA